MLASGGLIVTHSFRALIGLPTYRERDNLSGLLEAIRREAPTVHALVIDDNSPDGTGQLADEWAERDPQVHVLHRAGKLGLATAILDGMRYAIAHGFDFYISMDADFSHQPKYLPALLGGMSELDINIGSRYVPGGGTVDWPWSRKAISTAINCLTRWLFWMPIRDASGGYRCYRISLLRAIPFENILSLGYSFQQEMLLRCWKAGARIGETPIVFEDRRAGQTKVNLKEMARSLGMVLWLGVLNLTGKMGRRRV